MRARPAILIVLAAAGAWAGEICVDKNGDGDVSEDECVEIADAESGARPLAPERAPVRFRPPGPPSQPAEGPLLELPAKPLGWVSDFAGILAGPNKLSLDGVSNGLERRSSAELAVVTVASLQGRAPQAYARALFNRWGVGKKGKNNGVLMLVAPNERKVWIEVGYGLEGILPNDRVAGIINRDILPEFKRGDYPQGMLNGAIALAAAMEGRAPARRFFAPEASGSGRITDSYLAPPVAFKLIGLLFGWALLGASVNRRVEPESRWKLRLVGIVGAAVGAIPLIEAAVEGALSSCQKEVLVFGGVAALCYLVGMTGGDTSGSGGGSTRYRTRSSIFGGGGGFGGSSSGGGGSSGGGFGGFGGGSSGGSGAGGSW